MATKAVTKKPKAKSMYLQALDKVTARLDSTGLPWPEKPKDYGTEYTFPADITALSGGAIGKLQAQLAGWEGYCTRLLALADIDLDLLQTSFDIALNEKMAELQGNGTKRSLKDTLRAQALTEVPKLKQAAYGIAEKRALVSALKAQKSIYEMQRHAVSREQSRRSDELRLRSRHD